MKKMKMMTTKMTELEYEEKRAIEDHIRAMSSVDLIDDITHMMIWGVDAHAGEEEKARYKHKVFAIRIELSRRMAND